MPKRKKSICTRQRAPASSSGLMSFTELTGGEVLVFASVQSECIGKWGEVNAYGECEINDAATGFSYSGALPPSGWNLAFRSTDDGQ